MSLVASKKGRLLELLPWKLLLPINLMHLRDAAETKGYNPSDFFIDSQFSIVSVLLMLPSFRYQFELKTLYCFCYPPITKSLLLGSSKKQKHKKVLEFDMSNFLNLLWFERISLLMS